MTTEAPTKPATSTAIQFGTIPAEQMAKPKQYNSVSKEVRELREAFDGFVKGIPAGQVGVVKLSDKMGPRKAMGQIRGALDRCGLTRDRMVHNVDKNQIEVKLK